MATLGVMLVLLLTVVGCGGDTASDDETPGTGGDTADPTTPDEGSEETTEPGTAEPTEDMAGTDDLEEVELRFNFVVPSGGPQHEDMLAHFGRIIGELSDGKITVEEYPASSLIQVGEEVAGLTQGLADIADIEPAYNIGVLPNSKASDLPLIFPDHPTAVDVLYELVTDESTAIAQHFAERDLVVLWPAVYPGAQLLANRPVVTIDDFSGLRVRGPGGVPNETLEAFGASPTSIAPAEVYTAVDTGVVDGAVWALIALDTFGLAEVLKDLTIFGDSGLYYGVAYVSMAQERFDQLQPAAQEILREASAQMLEISKEAVAKWDVDVITNMEAADVTIHDFEEMDETRERARTIWDNWAEAEDGRREILDELLERIEAHTGG